MASHFRHIQFEMKRSVAHISLDRPPDNSLDIEMLGGILRALEQAGDNRRIKVLLLTSKHKEFCQGLDLEDHTKERVFQLLDDFHSVVRRIHQLGIPSVSVVNGAALGAGCALATFCDFVLSTESGRFGYPEIQSGLISTVGAVSLPRLIGVRAATELMLTGQILDARQAQERGLVSRAVGEKDVLLELESLLGRLTGHSAPVLRLAVQAIRHSAGLDLKTALENNQNRYLHQLMELADSAEGVAARKEQRPAVWKNQ